VEGSAGDELEFVDKCIQSRSAAELMPDLRQSKHTISKCIDCRPPAKKKKKKKKKERKQGTVFSYLLK
jgi:hypothetical protein